jgi:hypothetical protein
MYLIEMRGKGSEKLLAAVVAVAQRRKGIPDPPE